ncbi:MAG: hypothetical protein NTW54_06440 [Bacteroidetes bacterium]|nr:hypothetical protein [Bacteroidota bacterium]
MSFPGSGVFTGGGGGISNLAGAYYLVQQQQVLEGLIRLRIP